MQKNVNAPLLNVRKKLLTDSDWTQLPDSPLTQEQKTAWAQYRQQIRDLPLQKGYPSVRLPNFPTN